MGVNRGDLPDFHPQERRLEFCAPLEHLTISNDTQSELLPSDGLRYDGLSDRRKPERGPAYMMTSPFRKDAMLATVRQLLQSHLHQLPVASSLQRRVQQAVGMASHLNWWIFAQRKLQSLTYALKLSKRIEGRQGS